jgi:hypothetical protein
MNILAVTTPGGIAMFIVMLFIHVGIIVLTISLIIRLVIYLKTAGKERKLLRFELGKLAEEVRQIREKTESN